MPFLRVLMAQICALSTLAVSRPAVAQSKKESGGIGFVLLQALQRESSDLQPLLFFCSQTFQTSHTQKDDSANFIADIYALKIDPFTRKFQIFTKINSEQNCVIENLETLTKRHSCIKPALSSVIKQSLELSRDYQLHYRTSRTPIPGLKGLPSEKIQYELIVSSTKEELQFIRPKNWNWFDWSNVEHCDFRYFLRQKITVPDAWEPLIIQEDELLPNTINQN